jgi:hypothetical protein
MSAPPTTQTFFDGCREAASQGKGSLCCTTILKVPTSMNVTPVSDAIVRTVLSLDSSKSLIALDPTDTSSIRLPVLAFHFLTTPSSAPVTIQAPSGVQHSLVMGEA